MPFHAFLKGTFHCLNVLLELLFHVKQSGGLGYIRSDLADVSRALEIEILGERRPARILKDAPYDPDGQRLRM